MIDSVFSQKLDFKLSIIKNIKPKIPLITKTHPFHPFKIDSRTHLKKEFNDLSILVPIL